MGGLKGYSGRARVEKLALAISVWGLAGASAETRRAGLIKAGFSATFLDNHTSAALKLLEVRTTPDDVLQGGPH